MHLQPKAPFRPGTEVSQRYNDGLVTIYAETDGATNGHLPAPSLTPVVTLAYQERKLGIKRYYDARQNQIHVERVIRVQRSTVSITNQEIAETEDGKKYRIDLIQAVPDVYPPSVDLTLTVYEQDATAEDDEEVETRAD